MKDHKQRMPRGNLKSAVFELADGTRTCREIAELLGTTPESVNGAIQRMNLRDKVKRGYSNLNVYGKLSAETLRLRAEVAAKDAEIERLRRALIDHNDMLRSSREIANREGVVGNVGSTNWDAYYNRVTVVLKRHHETTNTARAALGDSHD